MEWLTNIYLWIGLALTFMLLFGGLLVLLIFLAKKTHAIIEFKAFMKGRPIALFFQENRYVDWRPVEVEAGIVQDKDYGAFIINERASYVDRKTKNLLLPFATSVSTGINVHAAKLADDFRYVVQDQGQLAKLRHAIANNEIEDGDSINAIRTTVDFSAIKHMLNAIIPHNINAKIEKTIAARLKNYGQVNVPQIAMLFAAIFGAILLGALVIRLAF